MSTVVRNLTRVRNCRFFKIGYFPQFLRFYKIFFWFFKPNGRIKSNRNGVLMIFKDYISNKDTMFASKVQYRGQNIIS